MCAPVILCPRSAQPQALVVRADERVELLSIVYHLAGAEIYNLPGVAAYTRDVDTAFAPFADHAVVRRARLLQHSLGIGFEQPMVFALHLSDAHGLREAVPFHQTADSKWPPHQALAFLGDLRAFVRDASTDRFFSSHTALYDTAARRLGRLVDSTADPSWFVRFFGHAPAKPFVVVPALLNGGANYGPRIRLPDGEQFYAILGVYRTDTAGWPVFGAADLPTVVHEFSHSFVNPVIGRHRREFADAGPRVLAAVLQQMKDQAYDEWATVVNESLVRVAVARYRLAHEGRAAALEEVADQRANGFVWMPELFDLFGVYEAHRSRYSDLEAFVPRIVAYWRGLPAHLPALIAQYDSARPRLISTSPADGATDVDPSVATITLRFDRPMRPGYSLSRITDDSAAKFPDIRGTIGYDSSRTVLTVPVRLEPGQSYALILTGRGFRSEEGAALARTVLRFRVRR
jgi:hypothetical protein